MRKILVTGGTGFIGLNVVQTLLSKNYEVHLISSQKAPFESHGALIRHELNLMNIDEMDCFFKNHQFDTLVHLAWYTGEKCHSSNVNIDWVIASMQLLKSFAKHGGQRFLGAGSVSEYDFTYGYLREDETPLMSKSIYGQCKSSLYQISKLFCQQVGIHFQWARIFNLYGPHEKKLRLMPSVILSMLNQEDVRVSDCIKQQDYLHVFDTADAIVALLESAVTGAVNICSGTAVRLRTVVEEIAQLMQFDGNILWGAIPSSFDDPLVVGCSERLTQEVGWSQRISLKEGLQQTIHWWERNKNV